MYYTKGVRQGDRVVIVAANSIETFLVWLATNWLGAVFSSSSTDMGVKGILQRSVQVNPKVCICVRLLLLAFTKWVVEGS